jgi:hypothetical protein
LVGYSLGALLLMAEPIRAARLGRVRLLAPIFAFPREAQLGGRISQAELRLLSHRLARDLPSALEGFYIRAGLDVLGDHRALESPLKGDSLLLMSERDRLLWGMKQLENTRIEPPFPASWRGWCGTKDVFLDAGRLNALEPAIAILEGATHHPLPLICALAEEVKA